MNIAELLRTTANRLGIDVCRIGPKRLGRNLALDLNALAPKNPLIFDVGANNGRAARWFTRAFPASPVWSFEPGTQAFEELAAAPDLAHVKKFKLALSDTDGEATLKCFNGSELNSLLPREKIADSFIDPGSIVPAGTQPVKTIRLASFVAEHQVGEIGLLKLDTQGFELHVLRGGEPLLRAGKVRLIQLEINFSPLYQGQPPLSEIYDYLTKLGFGMVGFYDVNRDDHGCMKWCDAVFKLNRPESWPAGLYSNSLPR